MKKPLNVTRPDPVATSNGSTGRARIRRGRIAFLILAMVACAGFMALGLWQIQRLEWKRDLITRVDARVHATPMAAPGRGEWPQVDTERDEYRRVRVQGRYLDGLDTRVQANTRLGAGWWLLRPFRTDDGDLVLVNRGFVPTGETAREPAVDQATTVTGLLRMDEPGGGFLRNNNPSDQRWYSRDVQAIARVRGLSAVAPFFIDADHTGLHDAWPAGGLTVIRFPNNHLPYALTWFTLAGLAAFGAWRLLRDRPRRHPKFGDSPDAATRLGIPR